MTNEIKEEANEVIKPFVFDCILTSTKEKVWKFCYDDQDGLNQHSGVYFKKEHAEKGMADFVSASKDDEITRLKEMLDAAREDEAGKWEDQLKSERERAGKLLDALEKISKLKLNSGIKLDWKDAAEAIDIANTAITEYKNKQ